MKISARTVRVLEFLRNTKVQDLLSVLMLLGVSLAFFTPALIKGVSFGPFDLLSGWPLTHGLYPGLHNAFNGDQIQQNAPWYALDWQLIHHGEFPLWDRYVLLGMPHFAGIQPAVLSLPTLISYLFPINVAYLVIVITTLFLAGTGAYFLARCLGLTPYAALFAGIAYQLSGPLASWVGWPLAVVNAWIPWLFAFSYLLLVSTRHRRLYTTLLAICIAFTIYAGHPESWFIAGVTGLLFFTSLIVIGLIQRRWAIRRLAQFALWEVSAIVLGACLAAPLLLPAIQLVAMANKGPKTYTGLPLDALNGLVAPAYYGAPQASSISFSPFPLNYYETVTYVGSLALILALYAIVKERARTEVLALACTAALWVVLIFDFGPAQKLINIIPNLDTVAFTRGVVPLGLCIGLLGAYGLRAMLRQQTKYPLDRWLLLLTTGVATFTFTAAIWGKFDSQLTPLERSVRFHSFWGSLLLIAALGAAAWLRAHPSKHALLLARGLLIVAEFCFLFLSGVLINSYSPQFFPRDAAVTQLIQTVGPNLLGSVNATTPAFYSNNGFIPNINIGYGVRQFAAYDPLLPRGYFDSWTQASGQPGQFGSPIFSPSIENAAVARLYGIKYVITPADGLPRFTPAAASQLPELASALPGDASQNQDALQLLLSTYISQPFLQFYFPLAKDKPENLGKLLRWAAQEDPTFLPTLLPPLQPYQRQYQAFSIDIASDPAEQQAILSLLEPLPMPGMTLVLSTPDYRLYEVPGAAQFTLAGEANGAGDSGDQVQSVEWLNNYTCRIRVRTTSATTLLIRLTNVPGWHAEVNGQPATLRSWRIIMQQMALPAGESTITLTYWPPALTHGLDLAAGAFFLLVLLWAVPLMVPWKRKGHTMHDWSDTAIVPTFGRPTPKDQQEAIWAGLGKGLSALDHDNLWVAASQLRSMIDSLRGDIAPSALVSAPDAPFLPGGDEHRIDTLLAQWNSGANEATMPYDAALATLTRGYLALIEGERRSRALAAPNGSNPSTFETWCLSLMEGVRHRAQPALRDVITWQTCSIVLPAFNEQAVIADTVYACVKATARFCPNAEIIVVDDGSQDATGDIADALAAADASVRVVHNQPNKGYGGALLAGFGAARGEWLFFMDSDGQFDITDIARLLSLAEQHPGAAILGYRARRQDRLMRKLNAWGWKQATRALLGVRGIRDIDCAFKLLPTRAVRACGVAAQGASVNAEMLAKLGRMGVPIIQVPVRHLPRTKGRATGAKLSVIARAFVELWRLQDHLKHWRPRYEPSQERRVSAPSSPLSSPVSGRFE